jgi:hypothetical protein
MNISMLIRLITFFGFVFMMCGGLIHAMEKPAETLDEELANVRRRWKNDENFKKNQFFFEAVFCGNVTIVKQALDEGYDVEAKVGEKPPLQWAPLHWAALRGHYDIVQLLLDRGARVDPLYGGDTPFDRAICSKRINVALLLLSRGARIGTWLQEIIEKELAAHPIVLGIIFGRIRTIPRNATAEELVNGALVALGQGQREIFFLLLPFMNGGQWDQIEKLAKRLLERKVISLEYYNTIISAQTMASAINAPVQTPATLYFQLLPRELRHLLLAILLNLAKPDFVKKTKPA